MNGTLLVSILIIVIAIVAIARQIDVRLVLTVAGLMLGALAGDPLAIVRKFFSTFSSEQYVVPICSAMGFAYVLKQTSCDQHLVHMLVKPIEKARMLLIPGAIVVGFMTNIPVISQTSTAVAIGAVLVPLLQSARLPAATIGATLLLGSSIGGELLNPGAPEFRTVVVALDKAGIQVSARECVERVFPLLMLHLVVSTIAFWIMNGRASIDLTPKTEPEMVDDSLRESPQLAERVAHSESPPAFRLNPIKALIPILPIVLLFVTGPPLNLVRIPTDWLLDKGKTEGFDTRLIGFAMLIGVAAAAATSRKTVLETGAAFFEGAGYAFARVVAIIVAASCFGEGVKLIGLAHAIENLIDAVPVLLIPTAGGLPVAFGWVCGSGMATTQALYEFFVGPALDLEIDPTLVGALVSIASAAGRTMSPVAAVTLMAATLTGTNPMTLVKRVAPPLLIGMTAVVTAIMLGFG